MCVCGACARVRACACARVRVCVHVRVRVRVRACACACARVRAGVSALGKLRYVRDRLGFGVWGLGQALQAYEAYEQQFRF